MRFLSVFLGTLAAIGILYAALTYGVDARGEFFVGRFPRVVLDTRSEKIPLLQRYHAQAPVQGVVFGSSRSMKLSPTELQGLTGLRFFNDAVDNARAEDYVALYQLLRQEAIHPRLLIIGLDVEALHDNDRPDFFFEKNEPMLAAFAAATATPESRGKKLVRTLRRWQDVYTLTYFHDTAQSIYLAAFGTPEDQNLSFEPDGYLRYRRWERQRGAGTFSLERELADSVARYPERFADMRGLSVGRIAWLEQTIRAARADGATVKIWLTCIHPDAVRVLQQKTKYPELLAQARTLLEGLSQRYGVQVYDYSSPANYGGTLDGWYDCGHIDETNCTRVVRGLAGNGLTLNAAEPKR